jgi:hypothetical protein
VPLHPASGLTPSAAAGKGFQINPAITSSEVKICTLKAVFLIFYLMI